MSRVGQNNPNYKHGYTHTRIHRIWISMKCRCGTETSGGFRLYGGRGIRVCDDWIDDFEAFHAWSMSNGYDEKLEIDRKDNDGPYAPWNCHWVTKSINCRNTRRNVAISAFGETKTIADWAEDSRCMVNSVTLRSRLSRGTPPETAIISKQIIANQFTRRTM